MDGNATRQRLEQLWATVRRRPRLAEPETRRRLALSRDPPVLYAVGDVHGCLNPLIALEAAIYKDAAQYDGIKLIVMLGDYIDRGPDSARVMDHLLTPTPKSFRRVCLAGNHEQALVEVLSGRRNVQSWLDLGGDATMLSYGLDVQSLMAKGQRSARVVEQIHATIPQAHQAAFRNFAICLSTPSYFFAHAGARPGVPLGLQADQDLMLIREPFLQAEGPPLEKLVVHGHSPTARPVVTQRRIGVDTGCYRGGSLTAVRIHGRRYSFLSAPGS